MTDAERDDVPQQEKPEAHTLLRLNEEEPGSLWWLDENDGDQAKVVMVLDEPCRVDEANGRMLVVVHCGADGDDVGTFYTVSDLSAQVEKRVTPFDSEKYEVVLR